ncbi:MAG: radical SAM protein [Bacillota bacterium]|nr:radical SAM protein [Bacillota bacterium]
MRYEGMVYRPPSEAYSLIVQVTIGCAHNRCTFCGMYKDKKFRVRPAEEVAADLQWARDRYPRVEKIFLADGDALVLPAEKLLFLLDKIRELFPECRRVGVYGSPKDILRKTPGELQALREAGMGIVYVGAESGSDKVLKDVCKGATAEELIEAVRKAEDAGCPASVTFISGLAGQEGWEDHARESGKMISAMEPSYASLLTLMVEPGTPLERDLAEGRFRLLTPEQVLEETALLLENVCLQKECVFRSNHASNYFSLRGTLPQDKELLLGQLQEARRHRGMLKDEWQRML